VFSATVVGVMVFVPRCPAIAPAQPALFPYWEGFGWARAATACGWSVDDGCRSEVVRISILQRVLARVVVLVVNGGCTLGEAYELALTVIREGFVGNGQTLDNALYEIARFVDYARNHDVLTLADVDVQLVHDFVHRAAYVHGEYRTSGYSTRRNRRAAMKRFFDTLGLCERPDLYVPKVTGTPGDPTRPLTDAELDRVHAQAYSWMGDATRRPLVVALSEAGGSALEVASVRLDDLDLDAGTVTFRGGSARTNLLAAHTVPVVRAALAEGAAVGERICVGDRLDDIQAKRSVTQELNQVITHAGVRRRRGVSGRSILLAAARKVLDSSGLEAAARFMGAESLDVTAASLGYDWRQR